MQNGILLERLGRLTIEENAYLNLRSLLVDGHVMTRISPLLILSYLYTNGADVFSADRRHLKNEILYILSSASVTIDRFPPLPLTFNLLFGMYIHHGDSSTFFPIKFMSLMTSIFTYFDSL